MITTQVFGPVDIAVLSVYFVAVAATGVYAMCSSKRDTSAGYFLAGRFITFIPIGASLFASNIGSEHFIGLAGSGAAAGIGVGAFELNALVMLQILGWVFLPVYLASGVITLPEYMQKRFGGRRIHVYLSVLSLAIYILTKMSVNLYSGSLFIKTALNWDLIPSLALIIGLTAFCTVTGGLAAVIYTDTIQAFLMCTGGMIMMIFAFSKVGGLNEMYIRYMDSRPSNLTNVPEGCGDPRPDSLLLLRDPIDSDMPWPGFIIGQTTASIWYWCADQVIVQRALAAKSLSHAQGGTIFAGYLKVLPLFMIVMPGMISRVLYPDQIACANPDICEEVCGNRAGCSNLAYPKLIMELMPTGLRGLMVAVMLAALITDLTSIFNSASSLFTMDVYPLIRKNPSNREQMTVGRLFVIVMTLCSILWIPIVQSTQGGQLYIYIQAITACLTPPIAAIYLTGLLYPRANEQGAFWALMGGLITGGIRMVLELAYKAPFCGEEETRPAVLRNVHYMYFALILFTQTVVLMVSISLLTRPLEKWRTIRTVYWQRFDETVRPDEMPEAVEEKSLLPKQSDVEAAGSSRSDSVEMVSIVTTSRPDVAKSAGVSCENIVVEDEGVAPQQRSSSGRRDPEAGELRSSQHVKSWLKTMLSWFCGFSLFDSGPGDNADKGKTTNGHSSLSNAIADLNKRSLSEQQVEIRNHVKKLVTSIRQDRRTRILLYLNLIFVIALTLFLLVFFSLPPESSGLISTHR